MKELDILLERYARAHLASASDRQRRVFTRLLELPDPLLADYLLGHAVPPHPELAQLARLISNGRPAVLEEAPRPIEAM